MLHTKLATAHDISVELGNRIKTIRQSKCLQQAELAARAGIARKTLVALDVHGQGSLTTFIRVASVLNQSDIFQSMLIVKPNSIAELERKATSPVVKRIRLSKSG